jgi:hypothetical protein
MKLTITAIAALAILLGAVPAHAAPTATASQVIKACVSKKGALRIAKRCRQGERKLSLLALPGAAGPKGADGANGTNGTTGPAGETGQTGAAGQTGPAGSADTAGDVLTKIKTVDGAGSGLDADLLDGLTSDDLTRTAGAGLLLTGSAFSADFGVGAGKVTQGDDARLSDARTPTGAAGGVLTGTYPNPTINPAANVTVASLTTPGLIKSGSGTGGTLQGDTGLITRRTRSFFSSGGDLARSAFSTLARDGTSGGIVWTPSSFGILTCSGVRGDGAVFGVYREASTAQTIVDDASNWVQLDCAFGNVANNGQPDTFVRLQRRANASFIGGLLISSVNQ